MSLRHLETWKLAGLCATHPDPDLWFSEDPAGVAAATALCGVCPVRSECLTSSLACGDAVGVWGGTTPAQRRHLAAERGLRRPSVHGAAQHGTRGSYNGGCRCSPCRRSNAAYVNAWRATRPVTSGGIVAVVHVLETPTGTGRRRAWPGQTFLDLGAAA
jgi:WhiB family redox-sensing transcriptional regulator